MQITAPGIGRLQRGGAIFSAPGEAGTGVTTEEVPSKGPHPLHTLVCKRGDQVTTEEVPSKGPHPFYIPTDMYLLLITTTRPTLPKRGLP